MTHFFKSLLLLCFVTTVACAQDGSSYGAHHFGIDTDQRIVVCTKGYIDALLEQQEVIEVLTLGELEFSLNNPLTASKTNAVYELTHTDVPFKLYITEFPIVKITSRVPIENEPKSPAQFQYGSDQRAFDSPVGIELRGNSALRYPKKSYDVELRKSNATETSVDASFNGLRKDDDWQFNSLYNEPLKLRSYVSNKLWLTVHQPSYISKEKEAKSGIDVLFSEVFVNNQYKGLYIINEQVDRKQLKLKKYKDSLAQARGLLYKATAYKDGTAFTAAEKFNNAFPSWNGFKMKYPYENFDAHYDDLHTFVNFVATSSDSDFKAEIATKLDLDNAIDYFLFINLLRGTDNISKNYFFARYDAETPFFFVPWDLDGVMGIIQDGKRIATTDDILSNHLFNRLMETDADNFNMRLTERWKTLRKEHYSNTTLFSEINRIHELLKQQKVYEREFATWPASVRKADDLEYLTGWLKKRLEYLDGRFE